MNPYDDPELQPIELGASIFVEVNQNLWRATEEFGLNRSDWDEGEDSMGLWDGSKFVITASVSRIVVQACAYGPLDQRRMVGQRQGALEIWLQRTEAHKGPVCYSYYLHPLPLNRHRVQSMVTDFSNLYEQKIGSQPFTNITALASELSWTDIVGQTTMDYFDEQGIYHKWTAEMVDAATRVNYGQVRKHDSL